MERERVAELERVNRMLIRGAGHSSSPSPAPSMGEQVQRGLSLSRSHVMESVADSLSRLDAVVPKAANELAARHVGALEGERGQRSKSADQSRDPTRAVHAALEARLRRINK